MVDVQGAGEERALRQASVICFARNQDLLVEGTKQYLADYFAEWLDLSGDPWQRFEDELLDRAQEAHSLTDARRSAAERRSLTEPYVGDLEGEDKTTVADMLTIYWEWRKGRFRDNFLPVHRKLSRDIGLVAPRTGVSQRYVLGDELIKTLVASNIPPGGHMEFHTFVRRLWDRYGLVIGPDEVGESDDWLRNYDVNRLYYQLNLDAFRLKLKGSGLLTEYSDATGLVVNRAASVGTVGG